MSLTALEKMNLLDIRCDAGKADTLEAYAYPIIGKLLVADISMRHVLDVLLQDTKHRNGNEGKLWHVKAETAKRLLDRIRTVLDYATVNEYRAGTNPATWKGYLDTQLPAPRGLKKIKHQPAVPYELVEEVLVARFVAGMDLTIAAVGKVARESRSKQEALVALHLLTAEMNAASRAAVRLERARLLGATQANPRLKKRLGQEQSRLTNGLTDLVICFQGKGWARQDLDARAIAVLVQAYTLGKVVDDIVDEPMSETAWNHLINQVVDLLFAT